MQGRIPIKKVIIFLFAILLTVYSGIIMAQGTLQKKQKAISERANKQRYRGFRDSLATIFSDTAALSASDYQYEIEKTYLSLNNILNKSKLGYKVNNTKKKIIETDSVLVILKSNYQKNNKALNVRNVQVFKNLLLSIQKDLMKERIVLDSAEHVLTDLKENYRELLEDTVLRQIWRDSAMREQFQPQLREMKSLWMSSSHSLRENLMTVNLLQTKLSSNAILTTQLLEKSNGMLNMAAYKVFSKENNYLWQKKSDTLSIDASSSQRVFLAEERALEYYFIDSSNLRLILVIVGLLFFTWIYRNIRTIRNYNQMAVVNMHDLKYLPDMFVVAPFVMMLSIAPLFDLRAPATYMESVHFLLLLVLTIIFRKKWKRQLFFNWVLIVLLFLSFAVSNHITDSDIWERVWFLAMNIFGLYLSYCCFNEIRNQLSLKPFLRFVIIFHNILQVLSILCNIFGRISLAQIFGNTAIFSITLAIALAVFSKIFMESILLQIIRSRVQNGLSANFDFRPVSNNLRRPVLLVLFILWLNVTATNLNIYNFLYGLVSEFLIKSRHFGNATFTIGGIVLFLGIVWMAHLLQRHVGYLFGDTGNDEELQIKGHRSRLLVARLVLLSFGYFLAVAASGIPVDKITIVLGALGVGIGLGLQNIVSNFVSGIILIFDRPLQIGDLVEVGDKKGRVREIGVRSSTLVTSGGAEVIIPNADILSRQIVNWTLTNNQQRIELPLQISGSQDMEEVASTLKKAIVSSELIFEKREPQILFTKVTEDGFEVKVYFWCEDVYKSDMAKSGVLKVIYSTLKAQGMQLK